MSPTLRIALAQINPTVGDIAGNGQRILQALEQAASAEVRLVVFPEMAILGYPPKDLLLKPAVIDQCMQAVADIARHCIAAAALVGYPCWSDDGQKGRPLYNAAALCQQGRIVRRHIKNLLPTYDVFDEQRYFEPGPRVDILNFEGLRLGVSICEDLWNDPTVLGRTLYHDDPIAELAEQGAQLFINCSASPFVVGKHDLRRKLFANAARTHGLPLLYCNQVGGNDELVFDGNSCVVDGAGRIIAQARDFEEDLLIVDVPLTTANSQGDHAPSPSPVAVHKHKTGIQAVYDALVLGLRDYVRKCGFKSIVLGLSGGIDSALTAALCVAAIGSENVHGYAMPSRFSSEHSIADAREVARRLKMKFSIIPIADMHEAFERNLTPHFAGKPADTTEENIQARIRGVTMMAMSNKFGSLLVTTGNKSELAVGYCTLYGDMCGGLAVLSDVPKTMVWELSRWVNTPACPLYAEFHGPVIPESSIAKVPSAELRPHQTDQDSLPPYDVLDRIIERYVEQEKSTPQIVRELADVDPGVIGRVVKLIDGNEYKRKQAAPGIKVTGRAFGFGRRMPIAQRYDSARSLKSGH